MTGVIFIFKAFLFIRKKFALPVLVLVCDPLSQVTFFYFWPAGTVEDVRLSAIDRKSSCQGIILFMFHFL